MMHRVRLPLMIGSLLAFPVSPAVAQTLGGAHHFEVSTFVGLATADGSEFSGTKDATGFAGAARYVLGRHLGLGVGVHYSDHGLQGFPEHLHIRALYGEFRYIAPLGSSAVSLFAGLRGGPIHERITIVDWTANGWAAGGLGGVDWQVLPPLALELQLTESAIHLGDRRGADGSVFAGTTVRGSSFGVGAGVAFRF